MKSAGCRHFYGNEMSRQRLGLRRQASATLLSSLCKKAPAIFIAGKRQSKARACRTLHQLI
jgi:hypothetical protein